MDRRSISRLLFPLTALVLALSVPTVVSATPIPIVNGGFDTGNFNGWTTTAAASGSLFGVDGNQFSGTAAAFFGGTTQGSYDTISQNLATSAGQQVTVSFWLANDGGTPANFQALWNGAVVTNVLNTSSFPYTLFTFSALATGPSSTLAFRAYQVPAFYFLDAVTADGVAAVPEPATLALVGAGLAFATRRYRRL